jgi:hypothetical protein
MLLLLSPILSAVSISNHHNLVFGSILFTITITITTTTTMSLSVRNVDMDSRHTALLRMHVSAVAETQID